MRGMTRNGLSNGRKSASDPDGRERHQDGDLIKRLEAENLALRNQAAQLALQIQVLRHIGGSEVGFARNRVRRRRSILRACRSDGVSDITSRRRPNRSS
jgi:hypothetical protein